MILALLLAATFSCPMERVTSTDPAKAQSAYDARVAQLLYETPLAIDYKARPYKLVPGYCELPTLGEDGKTYRFRVRDGEGRSATNAVQSLQRLKDPICPNGWIVKDVESMRVLSADMFEIRLARKIDYFPWLLACAGSAIVGPDMVGTGPFRLAKWLKNHEMVFTRQRPSEKGFDVVRYLVIDDATTQWLMFLRGEVDFLCEISRDTWDMIVDEQGELDGRLRARGIEMHTMPTLESAYVGFNMKDPVVGKNKKLRQALNCAFDYPKWEAFYNHRISPSTGPLPPGVEGRVSEPLPYRFDLDKARKLLAEAGYPGGIDPATGRRLVLTLSIGRPDQASRELGELLASFYDRIGVKLELAFMTWDAYLSAINDGRVQLFYLIWVMDYPHAQNILQLFYGPNRSPGVNHANYESRDYDAAYETGDYRRCQEILREDCPWIFTHYREDCKLTGPRVGNFVPSDFPYGAEEHFEAREVE